MKKLVSKIFVADKAKGETVSIGWLIIFAIGLIGSYLLFHK